MQTKYIMKTIQTTLTLLCIILLYSIGNAQGNCPGDKIKVYRGATGCGCTCQKECITPAELPVYLANGWNTTGCWNCCKAKNWVDAGLPETSPDTLDQAVPDAPAKDSRLVSEQGVMIRVMDMTGRYVATVADAFIDHETDALLLDESGLEPGIYICQLQSGGSNETKRISVSE
jgi:hypothetical protein